MTIMVKLNTIIHFDLISHWNMNTFSKMSVSVLNSWCEFQI